MSNDIAITVENLSKKYRIGIHQNRPQNLRELLKQTAGSPFRYLATRLRQQTEEETLWALRDVSFEIKHGEAVGIIGRNGAGKSTLLKILSRITDPTHGRAIIHGRVNSLLEVGTGFHGELTGRENIYLSAAIHGMKRTEIDKKFDEIVAFAEVEKFLDTPVKRYSSGMYVRLAFGVAAHLEPEILIVDEVLSVGDATFQKKCLGKMGEVTREGRTVFFVSHQMAAVNRLCTRGILLMDGRVAMDGATDVVTSKYFESTIGRMGDRIWDVETAPGDHVAKLMALRVKQHGESVSSVDIRHPVTLEMDFLNQKKDADLICCLSLFNEAGLHLFNAADLDNHHSTYQPGTYTARFTIPGNLLSEGVVQICAEVSTRAPVYVIHFLTFEATSFQVVDTGGPGSVRAGWGRPIPGAVRPKIEYTISKTAP